MSVAQDIVDGRLTPDELEAQADVECRARFGTVVGPGDPLWDLHVDVARQAVALGALSANELAEWVVVLRPTNEPDSSPSVDVEPESDAAQD